MTKKQKAEMILTVKNTGELVGNFSTRDRMGHFISPGASKAYGAMLNDPFPW